MGRARVSPNGVWKVLCRHGLNSRAKRLALVAGHRAPYEPPREPEPEPRVESQRPGELVGLDCFFVGHLHGTKGAVWQLTACDTYSSFAWAELVVCPADNPKASQTSALARRVARELKAAGWRLERVLTDNGNEFRGLDFGRTIAELGATHTRIRAGRPQTNGHVERLHRTILEDCWRPAFARYLQVRLTGLRRELEVFVDDYNFRRAHDGRHTEVGLRPTSSTVLEDGAEMSRKRRHISESVQLRRPRLRGGSRSPSIDRGFQRTGRTTSIPRLDTEIRPSSAKRWTCSLACCSKRSTSTISAIST